MLSVSDQGQKDPLSKAPFIHGSTKSFHRQPEFRANQAPPNFQETSSVPIMFPARTGPLPAHDPEPAWVESCSPVAPCYADSLSYNKDFASLAVPTGLVSQPASPRGKSRPNLHFCSHFPLETPTSESAHSDRRNRGRRGVFEDIALHLLFLFLHCHPPELVLEMLQGVFHFPQRTLLAQEGPFTRGVFCSFSQAPVVSRAVASS